MTSPEQMGQNVIMDDLSNVVILASCGMQQLPKIQLALSNMARRSRQQMQRKGVFLGGLCRNEYLSDDIPKQNQGILKRRKKKPTLSLLATYNDIWKAYSFSYHPCNENSDSFCHNIDKQTVNHWKMSSNPGEVHLIRNKHLCRQQVQKGTYQMLATTFPGALPLQLINQPSIEGVLLCRLKDMLSSLSPEERSILVQLHFLKMLSNIPMHKLLRGRPVEFILPIPRRARGPSHSTPRSLMAFQCVRDLPKCENRVKWNNMLSYYNNAKYLAFEDDPSLISEVKGKHTKSGKTYLGTTIPKGVSFITYPDSMDETSFEDTIGGRSLISWEKGTRFPQMGIDQSHSFKCRKELSRQHLIQNRLRAAKFQRRMTYTIDTIEPAKQPSFFFSSSLRKLIPQKLLKRKPADPWFRLTQARKSMRLFSNRNVSPSSSTARGGDRILRYPEVDDTTRRLNQRREVAERAERRKRLKMRILTILKYLSCGIVPYLVNGECKIFKRKRRISTVDSRESCPISGAITPVPLESPPQVSQLVSVSSTV